MTAIPLSQLATSRRWQTNFLSVLPAVNRHAKISFRRLNPTQREEATAEAQARACLTYATLVRQHKLHQVYVGNLATNSVKAVRAGRRVGGHQSCRDVLSPLTHKQKGIAVGSLTPWDAEQRTWRELAVESKRVSPADLAAFRLDFQTWFTSWSPRHRRIINALASGMGTMEAAAKFHVSPGRISQFRRCYQQSWQAFQGAVGSSAAA